MADDNGSNRMKGEDTSRKEATPASSGPRRLRGTQPQSHTPITYDFSGLGGRTPIDVAIEYAELHYWFLVPADLRTGKPMFEGVCKATRDIDQIRDWIEEQGLTVGIATGRASGLVALACKGDFGWRTLQTMSAGQDPFATLACSGKDTRVFLFRAPDEELRSQYEMVPGIDLLGENGCFVPDPAYWGTQNVTLSALPDWVRSLATGESTFGFTDLAAAGDFSALNHATVHQAAKAYQALGYKLVEVNSKGECDTALGEECTSAQWKDNPNKGLGLETGLASGIVGLLIVSDQHKAFLETKYGPLPAPHIQGARILHCFRPPQEGFQDQTIFEGITYIGEGEYLAVPPSTIDGTKLLWKLGKEFTSGLPELPPWLHDILSGKKTFRAPSPPQQQRYAKGAKWQSKGKAVTSGASAQAGRLGAAAQEYAARGWLVFPLGEGSKKPRWGSNGLTDATIDPEVIVNWWTEQPRGNIAVQTGEASGIAVLDVDVKKNQPGLETLADLERQHGKLVTLKAKTTTGGIHLFFRYPALGVGCRAGFLPGLDFRGEGGYIVVAPTRVDGKEYRWENSLPLIEMPDWLLTLVRTKKNASNLSSPAAKQEKLTYTDALRGVQEGARNDTIFRFACKLFKEEWEYDEALVLVKTAAGHCEPPFEEEEAIRCLESAWNYVPPSALSDMGNAERFVARYGEDVRFIEEKDIWLVWGGHWWKKNMHALYRMARGTIKSIRDEAMDEGDVGRQKALFAHSRKSESEKALNAMLEIAAMEVCVQAGDLDRGDLVAFTNGVFDPSTGTLRPGRREDLLSKHAPIEYDATNPECARWLTRGTPAKGSKASAESSKTWQGRLDRWLTERCKIAEGLTAKASDLCNDFSEWLNEEVSGRRFGDLMIEKGFNRRKSNGQWYDGVQIKTQGEK